MTSHTPLDLAPGVSLGPFALGSMLFNVLNHVRTYRDAYPHAKVAWDEERLARIEVGGMEPGSWVSYRGRPLQGEGDEEGEDVVKVVRRALGPTYGSSQGEGREEMLAYPGVAFGVVAGPSGSTLSRIILTPLPSPAGVEVSSAWLHPILPPSPAAANGDLRLAEIYLDSQNRHTRTLLHFYSSENEEPISPLELVIGRTTSEDLLCELGGAIRTFWKEDDRMSIHTASLHSSPSSDLSPNPYFLSYPHLGLTLLLSSSPSSSIPAHALLKIILHSNLPGEVNFGRTARCLWELRREGGGGEKLVGVEDGAGKVREVLRASPSPPSSGFSSASAASSGSSTNGVNGGGGKRTKKPAGGMAPVGKVKEQAVENLLGLSTFEVPSGAPGESSREEERGEEKPMILDRTASGAEDRGGSRVRGKTTEIHGYPTIALEVTQEGEVETVWVF
ncbi:hypothetical protein JCM10213v2_006310 [Rhodosporidiobolus nylandii]